MMVHVLKRSRRGIDQEDGAMNVLYLLVAVALCPIAVHSVVRARTALRDARGTAPGRTTWLLIAATPIAVTLLTVFMASEFIASALRGEAARMVTLAVDFVGLIWLVLLGLAVFSARWSRFRVPPEASQRAATDMAAATPAAAEEAEGMFRSRPVDPAILAAAGASGAGVLALARAAGGWSDRMRAYRVVIDGDAVAVIRRGKRLDLPLAAGRHEVYLKIDWCRSRAVSADLLPGQATKLFCRPAASTRAEMIEALSQPRQYILLTEVGWSEARHGDGV
jgi:hypothetical protein